MRHRFAFRAQSNAKIHFHSFFAESEAVRVAAIKEMFDRGFGRATQPIEGTMTYGVSEQLAELFRENASGTLGSEIARRALPSPNGEQPH